MRARTLFGLALLALTAQAATGCAVTHRYPAYRGRVLELGTDKPIEGAGVLAVYYTQHPTFGGDVSSYLGYQGQLTGADGRFEIPAKRFVALRPLSWFDDEVGITIFKYGYGNFPGSFSQRKPKIGESPWALRIYVVTDPPLERNLLPPEQEVRFWLPRLEGREEIIQHNNRIFIYSSGKVFSDATFPPAGTSPNRFGFGPAYRKMNDK